MWFTTKTRPGRKSSRWGGCEISGNEGLSMTLLDTAPDALLAERSAEGDETAFAVLVRRHAHIFGRSR